MQQQQQQRRIAVNLVIGRHSHNRPRWLSAGWSTTNVLSGRRCCTKHVTANAIVSMQAKHQTRPRHANYFAIDMLNTGIDYASK